MHYKCLLKREPNECFINDYDPSAWQANMGHSVCTKRSYMPVWLRYEAPYIMQTGRSMGELLKHVAAEAGTDELKSELEKGLVQHS